MRIGLVLDNPKRDLTGLLLLSHHLLARGHEVFIIPMYEQGNDVPLLSLDAIVVNYARTSNIEFLRTYKTLGVMVIVLDTEGGVFPETGDGSPEFWAKRFNSIGAFEYVDQYCFWGERIRQAYLRYSGLDESRLHVTGCPRYDVCHPTWRSMLSYEKAGYVLANMNFPSINPWWGQAEYLEREAKVVFHSAHKEISQVAKIVNVDVERAIPLERERMRAFNEYVGVIGELARRNPEQLFVVRPHPFENKEIYKHIFASQRNVLVDPFGEVMNVINNAKFVIHLNCSTSVESRLLDKVPVALEFLNNDLLRVNIQIPTQISYSANSLDDVDALIKTGSWQNIERLSPECFEQYVRPLFNGCDGNASRRVAELIHGYLASTPKSSTRSTSRYLLSIRSGYQHAKLRHVAIGLASQLFGSFVLTRLRMRLHRLRTMKYVRAVVVHTHLREIQRCAGTNSSLIVKYASHPVTHLPLASIQIATAA